MAQGWSAGIEVGGEPGEHESTRRCRSLMRSRREVKWRCRRLRSLGHRAGTVDGVGLSRDRWLGLDEHVLDRGDRAVLGSSVCVELS